MVFLAVIAIGGHRLNSEFFLHISYETRLRVYPYLGSLQNYISSKTKSDVSAWKTKTKKSELSDPAAKMFSLRLATLGLLYFVQGAPYGFQTACLPIILREGRKPQNAHTCISRLVDTRT